MAAGFAFSAASLGHHILPLALALVCACSSWPAVLSALGGILGYRVFWGPDQQPMVWLLAGLLVALLLGRRQISREAPLLLPAVSGLIIASCGLLFQNLGLENTPISLYMIRVALAIGATRLFAQVRKGRNPILEWLACGLGILALVQITLTKWFSFGFLAAGILSSVGAFPAVAIAGLALDIAN